MRFLSNTAEYSDSFESLVDSFFGVFLDFLKASPIMASCSLILIIVCLTTICMSPVLMYRSRQQTKKHENILKYRNEREKNRILAKVKLKEMEGK